MNGSSLPTLLCNARRYLLRSIQRFHPLGVLCRLGSRLFPLSRLCCSVCYKPSSGNNHRNLVTAFLFFTSHYSSLYRLRVVFRHILHNLYSTIRNKLKTTSEKIEKQEKREQLQYCVLRNYTIKRKGYSSLIVFENCHSPWMLHIETAIRVPGFPVFILAFAA